MKKLFLITGILILFAAEILRVYFIMPFPGSQRSETINIAYFLQKNISLIRFIALSLIAIAILRSFSNWKTVGKVFFILLMLLYIGIFYLVNFKFLADKMFYQPKNKMLVNATANTIKMDKLVIGVKIKDEAKAYPIEIIGYHHQVQDTVGGEPVMVTYCTVCRTGRVYSPMIDGKKESFRLVGMDHFNAMFEDATTKSWWRQVSGEALAGPLKGQMLNEFFSEQMTLGAWLRENPNSLIMQPDTLFKKQYDHLEGFDKGTIESSLEKRDSTSWQFKSWVIGVQYKGLARAYDWNQLVQNTITQDSLSGLPILIFIEPDHVSFHVWNRQVNDQTLQFKMENGILMDTNTQSHWNTDGLCTDGPMKGTKLIPVQASQEFWHSWKTFHPNTSLFGKNN